jgi:hypothetical protein
LLAGQASQALTGDDFMPTGPVIHLVSRLFSADQGNCRLFKEDACTIGDMRHSCMFAGGANGRDVVFQTTLSKVA